MGVQKSNKQNSQKITGAHTPSSIKLRTISENNIEEDANNWTEEKTFPMIRPKNIGADRSNVPATTNEVKADMRDDQGRGSHTANLEAEAPISKDGTPDRRYKGQRDLPDDIPNEGYTPAQTGGVVGNTHITKDMKPDRRFSENRGLTEEEARVEAARIVLENEKKVNSR